jgi:Holliday junction resolvase RusA-like endonuclease
MPKIEFSAIGEKPVAWGNNEWDWRRAVADEARTHRSEANASEVTAQTRFSVQVRFYVTPGNIKGVDLDNLAKPVLDTVFKSRHSQVKDPYLTGALFDVDDEQVYKLGLEKTNVSLAAEEGAEITIVW